jgi:hypothetical protein
MDMPNVFNKQVINSLLIRLKKRVNNSNQIRIETKEQLVLNRINTDRGTIVAQSVHIILRQCRK